MLQTKTDLKDYIAADKYALGITRKYPKLFSDEIWKYQIALRKCEYYSNIINNKQSSIYIYIYILVLCFKKAEPKTWISNSIKCIW